MQIRINTNCDGTPCEGKLSCTVWDGGKGGDNIKVLPIVIIEFVLPDRKVCDHTVLAYESKHSSQHLIGY